MAHAAAAVVPLRRPFLLSLKPTRLLSSLAAPSPGLRHPRALRPAGPLPSDAEEADDSDAGDGAAVPFKKSRNELKRKARRAVQWGMELAKFSPPQTKRILRCAPSPRDPHRGRILWRDAYWVILVSQGCVAGARGVRRSHAREEIWAGCARRKEEAVQLHRAQPELMDTLIQASKDGDDSKLHALLSEDTLLGEEEDPPDEEEDNEEYMKIADRWFEGLLCKDISVANEVYAVHNVEFDRQELRKLVRRVHMVQESTQNKDGLEESDTKLSRAEKPLLRFLRSLAKEAYVE